MGNCQTSEAATILIEHPDNRIERLYFSVAAQEVMSSNPGHYLALVITTTPFDQKDGEVKRQLKLLRPSDSLQIGHVYRLISFEDVLKEFNERKCAGMGKLTKDKKGCVSPQAKPESGADRIPFQEEENMEAGTSNISSGASYTRMNRQHWRPALQSISEVGT